MCPELAECALSPSTSSGRRLSKGTTTLRRQAVARPKVRHLRNSLQSCGGGCSAPLAELLALGVEASDSCVELRSLILIDPPGRDPFGQPVGVDPASPAFLQEMSVVIPAQQRLSRESVWAERCAPRVGQRAAPSRRSGPLRPGGPSGASACCALRRSAAIRSAPR